MRLAGLLNFLWMTSCRAEARAFQQATCRVERTQARILHEILRNNRYTAYGRAHGFDQVQSARDFVERVPIAPYPSLAPWIERASAGEPNVLTREPIRLFQPTSGSTGGEKWIPYTDSLRSGYQRGIAAWIGDLFAKRPAVRQGRAYWSVSPALGPPRLTSGGIKVGFDDDTAYLSVLGRLLVRPLLSVPPDVAQITDLDAFRYCTLRFLLAADDLSLISVWNPTFFTALLADLPAWGEQLVRDLAEGDLRPPQPLPGGLMKAWRSWLRPNPRRAAEVAAWLRGGSGSHTELWPRLALISCWTDASAGLFVTDVRRLFPGVEIQPKGLLATEAFVSIPLVDQAGAALAVRSHFFEFEEANGGLRLAHELDVGGRYRVLVTTGGGLYRYPLGDEIEVLGRLRQCSLIRFRGRSASVSDLVGEKLSEEHVQSVLERVFASLSLSPSFVLLAPDLGPPPRYRLYLEGFEGDEQLAAKVEAGLCENPYYRHAVGIGQLLPLAVASLPGPRGAARRAYEDACQARGMRVGNLKPSVLALPGSIDDFCKRFSFPPGGDAIYNR